MSARYYESHPEAVYRFAGRSAVKRANTPAWQCGCRPYIDVFTVGRWNAQGRSIARGAACEPEHRAGKNANIPVFCRCQLAGADSALAFTPDSEAFAGFDRPMHEDEEPISNFEYGLMQESGREQEWNR